MSEQVNGNNEFMEDISSSSKKFQLNIDPVDIYGKWIYRHISGIIKAIAYIFAIFTILIGIGVAIFIAKRQILYIALSFAVVLLFAIIALLEFFLIYAIGHILQQNNEILKRL